MNTIQDKLRSFWQWIDRCLDNVPLETAMNLEDDDAVLARLRLQEMETQDKKFPT